MTVSDRTVEGHDPVDDCGERLAYAAGSQRIAPIVSKAAVKSKTSRKSSSRSPGCTLSNPTATRAKTIRPKSPVRVTPPVPQHRLRQQAEAFERQVPARPRQLGAGHVPARVEPSLQVFDRLQHEEIRALVVLRPRHRADPGEHPVGKLEIGHAAQPCTSVVA